MEVLANLKNIVILDCDKDTFYKKVESVFKNIKSLNKFSLLHFLLTCLFVLKIIILFKSIFRFFLFLFLTVINVDKLLLYIIE